MRRELAIGIYLFVFRILFNICKLFPQKKKTVGVASFGDNIFYTAKALRSLSDEEIILLKEKSCKFPLEDAFSRILSFNILHPIGFIQSIYHLATATTVLVDNYHGFLAVTNFRPGTTCIQLWHAAGAIKKFGLEDPSISLRSKGALARFQKVYQSFDYTVVGSKKMEETFQRSFGLKENQFLRTGIPRTDLLFDTKRKKEVQESINNRFPSINGRKIILYAPTFRKDQLKAYQLEIDVKQMYEQLSDEYVLFVKLHPAVANSLKDRFDDFMFDVSDYQETNELLLVTDLLITDYSSIPFEYALLEKPMIFFAYDMDEYKVTNGLIDNYEEVMPGPVVFSTFDLVRTIQDGNFDIQRVRQFAKEYNEFSNGNSSLNVARFILGIEEEEKEKVSV